MNINQDTLTYIVRETKCEWTRGFISCLLHTQAPARNEVAREIIEAVGLDRKIECIKRIRGAFNLGLKEAKAVVDEYQRSGQIVFPGEDNEDGTRIGA